jgi:hypothetical protein
VLFSPETYRSYMDPSLRSGLRKKLTAIPAAAADSAANLNLAAAAFVAAVVAGAAASSTPGLVAAAVGQTVALPQLAPRHYSAAAGDTPAE